MNINLRNLIILKKKKKKLNARFHENYKRYANWYASWS